MDINHDIASVAKGAGIVFIGTLLARLLALGSETLIVRALPPGQFGHIALAFTVISSIASLTLLGIPNGITRFLSARENDARRDNIFQSGLIIVFTTGIIAAIGVIATRNEIAAFLNDNQLTDLLILFAPYIIVYPLAQTLVASLRAEKKATRAILSRNILPRLGAFLIFGGSLYVGSAYVGAVLYWVSLSLIMFISSIIFVARSYDLNGILFTKPNMNTTRNLWSFSWPLALGSSLFLLHSNLDLLMIGYFLDTKSVGYYRSIQPLRQTTIFVLGAFGFIFLPAVTERYENGDLKAVDTLYKTTTKWIVFITFPIIIVLCLFSVQTISLLFGEKYIPAAPALSILTGGLFFRAFVGLNGDLVVAINRPRIELISVAIGVIFNIILNIILIPQFGIVGASVATVSGYFIYNSIEVGAIYYFTGTHPISKDLLKPLVPTTVASLFLWTLLPQANMNVFMFISLFVSILMIQFISVFITKSFSDADRWIINQIMNKLGIDVKISGSNANSQN
jgi:stage V sporulation protein B